MSRESITYYYVQAKKEGELPEMVYHTHDEEKNEYYYKFIDRKKAEKFAEAEKKNTPEIKFRVVRYIEMYDAQPWI